MKTVVYAVGRSLHEALERKNWHVDHEHANYYKSQENELAPYDGGPYKVFKVEIKL